MTTDFCISCGGLLTPGSIQCSICGFDNYTDQDLNLEDDFLTDLREEYDPEDE